MENKLAKYILIVLTVLCAVLIVLSTIRDDVMNPVRNSIGYVLVPVQRGVNAAGSKVFDYLKERTQHQETYRENKELREKIGELTEENNRLKSQQLELDRLRELYKLDQEYLQYPKVAARIIAKDSEKWFQIFRIDKGAADGIEVNMNVISGGGLVGIVTDVGSNYATVRAIIDDESSVSAMSQHSSDTCIVSGDLTLFEDGLLKLTNISKNANINNGDAIVTSDISTKFLPGILIGYASEVDVSTQHLTKSGYLIPVADFDHLREVLVITELKRGTAGAVAESEE